MWGQPNPASTSPGADWRVVGAWLLAVAGIVVFDSGRTALRVAYAEYPERSALIERHGPIDIVFVDTPGRGGSYVVQLVTGDARIGSWPGCIVTRGEVEKFKGKQARVLYLGNAIYEASVGDEFLCTHDPQRGIWIARMGRALQALGVGCFLVSALMMFPVFARYGRRWLKRSS